MANVQPSGAFRTVQIGTVAANGTITGVTTGTGLPINMRGYPYLTVYLRASAALSAGVLIIEEADYDPTHETVPTSWSQVTSVTLATPFASTGGQVAVHLGGPGGAYAYSYVRCRIGTTVVGGLLIATLVGC